jgi:hypothetical protein
MSEKGALPVKCRKIQKRLSAWMDGELEPQVRSAVDAHLADCDQCRSRLAALQNAWDLAGMLPEPDSAPFLYTRIRARLESEKAVQWFAGIRRILVPVSMAAMLALGFWLGSFLGKNGSGQINRWIEGTDQVSSIPLESFDDFPAYSTGDAYFVMLDQK